jgi:hypothetical protein
LAFCPEVYAAREKNGVYMPKERYYQEESERKVLLHSPFLHISFDAASIHIPTLGH